MTRNVGPLMPQVSMVPPLRSAISQNHHQSATPPAIDTHGLAYDTINLKDPRLRRFIYSPIDSVALARRRSHSTERLRTAHYCLGDDPALRRRRLRLGRNLLQESLGLI